jgi:hypothetical protein
LVYGLASGWTVRGPNLLDIRPDQSCGPSSLLYNAYRVSIPGVKRPGRGVGHLPLLAPKFKMGKLYLCLPSMSRRTRGCVNFTFTLLNTFRGVNVLGVQLLLRNLESKMLHYIRGKYYVLY